MCIKLLKVGENVVRVSNSLNMSETPSHPDPSCLHIAIWLRLGGRGEGDKGLAYTKYILLDGLVVGKYTMYIFR